MSQWCTATVSELLWIRISWLPFDKVFTVAAYKDCLMVDKSDLRAYSLRNFGVVL